MPFSSSAISIRWDKNNLIMLRGASQLLITAEHVGNLRSSTNAQEFEDYFKNKALVNREAKRVFGAWERKDEALLPKLQKEICE